MQAADPKATVKTPAAPGRPRPSRRGRGRQRGATAFLVTLVMTMLAALGVFAARATSLSGRASGYLRQGEQSHYLMQHAMSLALYEADRGATAYAVRNQNSSLTHQNCSTTANYPTSTIDCVKFVSDPNLNSSTGFNAMVQRAQQAAGKTVIPAISQPTTFDPQTAVPGSLGPWPLMPLMYVEMTDMAEVQRPQAGMAVAGVGSQFHYRQATFVAWGQVGPYPVNGPTASCSDISEQGSALVVSREVGRGQVLFGPIDNGNAK